MRFLILFIGVLRICLALKIDYDSFSSSEDLIAYEERNVYESGL